jgi:hypothetical protein
MKTQHPSWHWVVVAAVAAVAVFTLSNVWGGQGTANGSPFEGRPALSGAQAGTGAMAGPPQGGLGPQGVAEPGGGLVLRGPANVQRDVPIDVPREVPGNTQGGPVAPRDPGMERPSGGDAGLAPRRDRGSGDVVKRERGSGNAIGDEGRAAKKAKRAGKRSVERARRGVGGVDS